MAKRLSHEEADRQIFAAMQEPASMKVQRFRQIIEQRGGQAAQPFGEERAPREPRISRPRELPARTTV